MRAGTQEHLAAGTLIQRARRIHARSAGSSEAHQTPAIASTPLGHAEPLPDAGVQRSPLSIRRRAAALAVRV